MVPQTGTITRASRDANGVVNIGDVGIKAEGSDVLFNADNTVTSTQHAVARSLTRTMSVYSGSTTTASNNISIRTSGAERLLYISFDSDTPYLETITNGSQITIFQSDTPGNRATYQISETRVEGDALVLVLPTTPTSGSLTEVAGDTFTILFSSLEAGPRGNPGQDGADGTNGAEGRFFVSYFIWSVGTPADPSPGTWDGSSVSNLGDWDRAPAETGTGDERLWEAVIEVNPNDNSAFFSTKFVVSGPEGAKGDTGAKGDQGDQGAATRGGFIKRGEPTAAVTITTPSPSTSGAWSEWTDIAALAALNAGEVGNILLHADVHGEVNTVSSDGADRLLTESRIVRVRGSTTTTLADHIDYSPRNINATSATSTAFSDATEISDEGLHAIQDAQEGDVFKLQARIISQVTTGSTRQMTFSVERNSIVAASVGGIACLLYTSPSPRD